MRHDKINELKSMIPMIKNMVDTDLAIGIWDEEGVLLEYDAPETFSLELKVGMAEKIKSSDLFVAMQTRKKVPTTLPKDRYGHSIEGNYIPVFDNNEVVGCIGSFHSAHSIKSMEEKLSNVTNFMKILEERVTDVSHVVNSIKTNSSRTNMLALNASIEAARAGESGRGFSIVASELGKLSQMSSDSTTDIAKNLDELIKSMSDVMKALNVD